MASKIEKLSLLPPIKNEERKGAFEEIDITQCTTTTVL
jgi:hypothetical protein